MRRTVLCVLLLSPLVVAAQSTSPWKRIGDPSFGDTSTPSPGSAYMTLFIRAATVYQNSNWWTNFVEKNRQSVLTINLDGTVAGIHVSKTITGNPVTLKHNDSMVDLGYSGIVVDHLPTTFSAMTFNLKINKTAQDGLANLMTMVANLSQAQPAAISISQQSLGLMSLSKSLADYLFNKNLLETKMNSQSPIPSTGLLAPGVYVCLSGDSLGGYQSYFAQGSPALKWDGTTLTFGAAPVQHISYFVIEVGYQKTFFAQPLDALSFGAEKPWAALYLLAKSEVPKINTSAEAQKIHDDIQTHLSDARTLLNTDADFVQAERDGIDSAVYGQIQSSYSARLHALGILTSASVGGGATATNPAAGSIPSIGTVPPILLSVDSEIAKGKIKE